MGIAVGQKPTDESTPKTDKWDQYRVKTQGVVKPRKADITVIKKCRELAGLSESALDGFQQFPTAKLDEIKTTVYECLDSYEELTKYQLASLGYIAGWTEHLIDQENVPAPVPPSVPQLSTGTISLYPLDMGQTFSFSLDSESLNCKATSTQQLECKASNGARYFTGAIAEQDRHEYLIGCVPVIASQTCMGLHAGVYTVLVHSRTVTVLDSGMAEINTETGKTIAPLTPVFSLFTMVK